MAAMAVFARVVERKSFSGAAQALGLSKSAVSKQIAKLEALAGARLLRRTTRSLSLTQAGEVLYERASQAVALVSHAAGELSSFSEQPRGVIRVTAPVTFGRLRLVPRLKEFLARHPQVQIHLVLLDRPVDLAAEGFDLAVRLTPKLPAGVIARSIGGTQYKLVAKAGYFSKGAAPRSASDLARVNCLRYENTDALSTWQLSGPDGNVKVRVSGNLAVNNSESLRELVLAGLGVAVLPGFVVDGDLRTGRLEEVLRGWRVNPPFATDAHIVWLPDRQLTPRMRAFIDFLVSAQRSTS
jgi:DNA-binding transcriptional LysR family regulator